VQFQSIRNCIAATRKDNKSLPDDGEKIRKADYPE
jgi:hypothetical protein